MNKVLLIALIALGSVAGLYAGSAKHRGSNTAIVCPASCTNNECEELQLARKEVAVKDQEAASQNLSKGTTTKDQQSARQNLRTAEERYNKCIQSPIMPG